MRLLQTLLVSTQLTAIFALPAPQPIDDRDVPRVQLGSRTPLVAGTSAVVLQSSVEAVPKAEGAKVEGTKAETPVADGGAVCVVLFFHSKCLPFNIFSHYPSSLVYGMKFHYYSRQFRSTLS